MKLLKKPSILTVVQDKFRIFRETTRPFMVVVVFFVVIGFCTYLFVYTSQFNTRIYNGSNFSQEITRLSQSIQTEPTQILALTPTPLPSLIPVELIIPKINIHAGVEHVGQTKTFQMDVPKNAAQVAWYVYGPKPGESGNAVISGHYDTPTGAPGALYRLRELEIGDEIKTISEDGVEKMFVVSGKERHNYNRFPSEFVFHTREGINLNIITCDGIWDRKNGIYNDRLVIYTSLIDNV